MPTPTPTSATSQDDTATDSAGPRLERLSINVTRKTAAAIRGIASDSDLTITDTIRRAIAALEVFEDARKSGSKIIQVDADGTTYIVKLV